MVVSFFSTTQGKFPGVKCPSQFSMSNSLYFLSLHILKDFAGDLPCNQTMSCFHLTLLAKRMACSSVLKYICVPVSPWLLVQNLCGCLKGPLPSLWYLQPVPGLLASHHVLLKCFRIPDSAKCLNTSNQWLWLSWLRCRAAKKSKPTHRAWWDLKKNPLREAEKGKAVLVWLLKAQGIVLLP